MKSNDQPLYMVLVSKLLYEIKNNYKPNDKLPSERDISLKTEMSRNTVRQALDKLERLGEIERIPAKGSFVASQPPEMDLGETFSFSEKITEMNGHPFTKIISLEKQKATTEIARKLSLAVGSKVIKVVRLREANDIPMMVDITFLPQKLFPNVTRDSLENISMYKYFSDVAHQDLIEANDTISASRLSEKIQHLLELQIDFGIQIERISKNSLNRPIEYTISFADPKYFVYKAKHLRKE